MYMKRGYTKQRAAAADSGNRHDTRARMSRDVASDLADVTLTSLCS